ncbi:hypothetical protein BCR44DRAFT_53390 [Catenaria anguillulae PL171]|uniref:Fucosyltransferase n=1 Tax=Catenaria anguillulae PL171 TaxID=765915 RepID=A0A1Y2HQK0_9FUNG|nr:hypothetical protein BCR44DRAFT_53390 [Catenaria anguillulae PL171]
MVRRLTRPCRFILSALLATAAALVLFHRHRSSSFSIDEWDRDDAATDPPRHLPLLIWSNWYGWKDFWEGRGIDYCGTGKPACIVTHDRSMLEHSPVVLFHNADFNPKDIPKREKGKPWVLFGRDAPIDNPWQLDPHLMRHFDLSMTHRTDSDFPIPWFDRSLVDEALRPLDDKRIAAKFSRFYDLPPLVWAENECNPPSRYPALVRELQKHVPMHSYGECENTLPKGRDFRQAESHVRVIEPYKFVLVTEYATCDQFVQSKLMNAFRAGIVPVVDGPSNYSQIAPSPNAIIHVNDFASLADLAAYLVKAANDKQLYLKHLDYRTPEGRTSAAQAAWRKFWGVTMERGEWSGWCHMCAYATRRHFAKLRRVFPDHKAFVRAFQYRLTDQMTWHDRDPRLPPSPHVVSFLQSIPEPGNSGYDDDPEDGLAKIKSEFSVQAADQSCVVGKWAELDVSQRVHANRTLVAKLWKQVQERLKAGLDPLMSAEDEQDQVDEDDKLDVNYADYPSLVAKAKLV